jgi:GT2 family glycosyltransferase
VLLNPHLTVLKNGLSLAHVDQNQPENLPMTGAISRYGVVVIGRNEGERLRQCLVSLGPGTAPLVYVDSGSTDGSVALATALSAAVVALDMTVPFTAARARNEGFKRLTELAPGIEWVQFVDGDCEVQAGWLVLAQQFLSDHPDVVAVTGRRNERYPERSIYNTLCEIDWQGPAGESRSFGGDVLLRADALQSVGGYNPNLIAGEEPELSIRLRGKGWKIWHLDAPMTLHDANMLRFMQWWRRVVRTGFAYAEGAAMNGAPPERHWVRETASACWWGLAVPVVAALLATVSVPASLAVLCLYPAQVLRIYARSPMRGKPAGLHAFFLVLGKFAEATGAVKYVLSRLQGKQTRIIEYK